MVIKKNSINVSFYLSSPEAKTQSQVYCSLSMKGKSQAERLRFATGESFLVMYCNKRGKKGGKDLLRRNTAFFLEYRSRLDAIRDKLFEIAYSFQKRDTAYTLADIRNEYYMQTGRIEKEAVTFEGAWRKWMNESAAGWGSSTVTKVNSTLMHLQEYEKAFGTIDLDQVNEDFWTRLRDLYFTAVCGFNNSTTNKYLSFVRQFLRWAAKKGHIEKVLDMEDWKYLDEVESYNIALKLHEVEALMNMDLTSDTRLEKVRDLFVLEVLTGQRWSDVYQLLDKEHLFGDTITIYQKKTLEKVHIPLHPKLKAHMGEILKKYPAGLPEISNQKFNEYLKDLCKFAGFTQEHSWITLSGKKRIKHSDRRYNLVSSHTGRRTFCVLALASGISPEVVMRVTGHKKYEQFRAYVRVDDADISAAFKGYMNEKKDSREHSSQIL